MKYLSARSKVIIWSIFSVLFLSWSSAWAQAEFYDKDIVSPSSPPRLVNDFGGMIDANGVQELEAKLLAFNDSTSTQIAIVTVPSLGDYPVEEYGIRLARKWKIGQKDKDNGILILLAKQERKIDIQTGYGVGQYISDIDANRIIRELMVPNFKNGDYFTGLDLATDRMILLLGGGFVADSKNTDDQFPIWVFFLILIILIIFIRFASKNNGGNSGPQTYSGRGYRRSSPPPFFGGGFGGGGFGGSSGGGFGGFGGGGFGGGGASGDW